MLGTPSPWPCVFPSPTPLIYISVIWVSEARFPPRGWLPLQHAWSGNIPRGPEAFAGLPRAALPGRCNRRPPSSPTVCLLPAAVDTRPAEGPLCHGPGDCGLGPGCPPAEEATAEEEAGRARDGRRASGHGAPPHPHGQEGPVGEER